jgi:hypothetical protein
MHKRIGGDQTKQDEAISIEQMNAFIYLKDWQNSSEISVVRLIKARGAISTLFSVLLPLAH